MPSHAEQAAAGKSVGFWLAFSAIAVLNLAVALDASTLSVALPTISADLGGSSIEAVWAGTSYPLAQAALMLLWVSFSHCFGRRPAVLCSLVFFGVGAILAAVARAYPLLLAGRTLQGVGGGGLVGLTTVVITDLAPLRERPRYYALISAVWALGSTIGPIIGGALSIAHAWRWIFWINLPIVGFAFFAIAIFLRLNFRQRLLKERLQEIDILGSALFIASVTAFLVPITWGGTLFSWNSWHTIVPLCLGAVGMIVFCGWEIVSPGPTLIPMSLFLNHSATILYIGSLFHGLILWSIVYYMTEYFQAAKGYSPLVAGVAGLPQTVTIVPCAVIVGIVVGKTGKYRWAVWSGWVLTTFGMGLLIYLDAESSIPQWIFLRIVSGIGIGLLFPSIALAIQASTPPEEAAMASTLVLWFRTFGQTLGVAIGGAIVQNRMKVNLQHVSGFAGNASASAANVVGLVDYLNHLPAGDPQVLPLRRAFAASFQTVWAVMCGLAGAVMLVTFFVKEYTMNQVHLTEQGFREDARTEPVQEEIGMDISPTKKALS